MNAGSQRNPAPLPRGCSSPANRRKHGRSRTRKSERGSSVRVSSRSAKVIDLGVNRKRMWLPSYYHSIDNYVLCYYSLIVTLDVSPNFFYILAFKARKRLVFTTAPFLTPRLKGTLRIFGWKLTPQKPEGWGYSANFTILTSTVFDYPPVWLTDRQTDERAIA